jgi:hypothetical protein
MITDDKDHFNLTGIPTYSPQNPIGTGTNMFARSVIIRGGHGLLLEGVASQLALVGYELRVEIVREVFGNPF